MRFKLTPASDRGGLTLGTKRLVHWISRFSFSWTPLCTVLILKPCRVREHARQKPCEKHWEFQPQTSMKAKGVVEEPKERYRNSGRPKGHEQLSPTSAALPASHGKSRGTETTLQTTAVRCFHCTPNLSRTEPPRCPQRARAAPNTNHFLHPSTQSLCISQQNPGFS